MNDATRLPAPSATSSRFGLTLYANRAAVCFAATMLSRNPMTAINLRESGQWRRGTENTHMAVDVVLLRKRTLRLRSGKAKMCFPCVMGMLPKTATPSPAQSNSLLRTTRVSQCFA